LRNTKVEKKVILTGSSHALQCGRKRIIALLKSFRKLDLYLTRVPIYYPSTENLGASTSYVEPLFLTEFKRKKSRIEEATQTVFEDKNGSNNRYYRYYSRAVVPDFDIYGSLQGVLEASKIIERLKGRFGVKVIELDDQVFNSPDFFLIVKPQLEKIKEASGCCSLNFNSATVAIGGDKSQIQFAEKKIVEIIERYKGMAVETVPLPSQKLAIALFGKGGERINSIKEQAQCLLIRIDTAACTVTLKAATQNQIDSGKKLIAAKLKEIEAEGKKSRFIMKLTRGRGRGSPRGRGAARGRGAGSDRVTRGVSTRYKL